MSAEEFNSLDEQTKRVLIFEADKVEEVENGPEKFELFSIDHFFVEIKTYQHDCIRRSIKTYEPHQLPRCYSYTLFFFSNQRRKIS